MLFKTNRPYYTINRGGEKIIADSEGVIETNNEEAIEVLQNIFGNIVKTVPKVDKTV